MPKGLAWEPSAYNLDVMKVAHTPEEIKAEYTRLRKNFLERMRKIERAGMSENVPQTYLFRKTQYKPASKLSVNQMALALRDVAAALQSPYSTKSGIKRVRKKTIESFRQHGFSFVNESNLNQFNEFMQMARIMTMGRQFDSDSIASWYRDQEADELTETEMLNAFEKWLEKEKSDQLERVGGSRASSQVVRKKVSK